MDESTLRSKLSQLEGLRSSLHSSFRFWDWVVVVGVAFEFVVLAAEYWNEWHAFRRATIRSPEKPRIWLFVVGLCAVAMVAGGITKELGIDSQIESVETQIRGVNEQLLGDTEGKLRQLQTFALARHITDTDALVEALKPFKGRPALLRSYMGDAEGWLLCVSLLDATRRAQMNATTQCGQWPFDAGKPITGLQISGHDAYAVADAIVDKGRTTGGAVAQDESRPLLIFIGIKNPFWLPEKALAAPPRQKKKNPGTNGNSKR
jgi:hypothetical protein